ncbi:ICE-like protease (Caspase) p20 domain protein [Mycena venus]|uniref:ICE-like protease (Caspase) p20 domain protein n=1 Tax=Mycena venus TaxID=2733690 RepID=A0A8H6YBD1_9AGAR|nr:ICE-like protease (Caspase) p20 domain protein [Mycena venus]
MSCPGHKVFALIIGIDKYKNTTEFNTLKGAVNDAEAFRNLLVDSGKKRGLGVPKSNIRLLLDKQATRDGILKAFVDHLLNNPRIPDRGDAAMIFFFAGHGTRVSAPNNLMSQDQKVEGICPVDERTCPGGKYVHTIPDYVLVYLLQELSEKKGQNITVIVDSCHSGGMGRDGRVRAANFDARAIPGNLDSKLFTNNNPDKSTSLRARSATHVWLAACDVNETARESKNGTGFRGRFTCSLIKKLREVDRENTTYVELMQRLELVARLESWNTQTPCCGGERRNLLLFASKYPPTGPSAMSVAEIPVSDGFRRQFRVEMGEPAGVVFGTEFRVVDRDNHPVCTLVAQDVGLQSTILSFSTSAEVVLPSNARAVVLDWRNMDMILDVFVPEAFPYLKVPFRAEPRSTSSDQTFVQKLHEDDAHIALGIPEDANGIVVVKRLTPIFECEPEARFPLPPDPELRLPNALNGIAHFNYFLERRHGGVFSRPNPGAVSPLDGVSLEVYRLKGEFPTRVPDGENLVKNGKVSLNWNTKAYYGIRIRNTTAYDLFPYLFAFDATEYTIQLLYEPHGAKAPLRSNVGEVTAGMGGQPAYQFGPLWKDVKQSSTFFKVFVAAKPIDIAWIEQGKPFDSGFEGRPRFPINREPLQDTWDAFRITVTMAVS